MKFFNTFVIILLLSLFSSCGFVHMDFSVAADQFTDFSPDPPNEETEDCGCDENPVLVMGPCPKIHAPVCGCNGITYPNSCIAEYMGITCYTRGKCPDQHDTYPPGPPNIVSDKPTISETHNWHKPGSAVKPHREKPVVAVRPGRNKPPNQKPHKTRPPRTPRSK